MHLKLGEKVLLARRDRRDLRPGEAYDLSEVVLTDDVAAAKDTRPAQRLERRMLNG